MIAKIDSGRFRFDLYERLAGHPLSLPPLRTRREDIGLLIGRILEADAPSRDVTIDADAARALHGYTWPSNIRQLRNALTASLAICEDDVIRYDDLPAKLRGALGATVTVKLSPHDQALRTELVSLLGEHRGNVSAIARAMGEKRGQVRGWLKHFGLSSKAYRPDSSP